MALTLVLAVVSRSSTSAQHLDLPPTPLEAFAGQPETTLAWSRTVGELQSATARATADAVIYQNGSTSPANMRGLRISLTHLVTPASCASIFLSHSVLCSRPEAAIYFLESEFDRVKTGLARRNAEENLIVSFKRGRPGSLVTGIIIGGYEFGGTQADDLIRIVDTAVAALAGAPR